MNRKSDCIFYAEKRASDIQTDVIEEVYPSSKVTCGNCRRIQCGRRKRLNNVVDRR